MPFNPLPLAATWGLPRPTVLARVLSGDSAWRELLASALTRLGSGCLEASLGKWQRDGEQGQMGVRRRTDPFMAALWLSDAPFMPLVVS